MLGFAAGDNVELLARKFHGAHVTAVEWDVEMVRLADELDLYKPQNRPEVIVGDAREVLKSLNALSYDLVLVDIFNSKGVAPSAYQEGFFKDIAKVLTRGGYVAVNAYMEPRLLDTAAADLHEICRWKQGYNRVGIFQKMP